MPVVRTKQLEIPMEHDSAWTVVLTFNSDGDSAHVGLHYGNKPDPTHEAWVPIADIREMFEDDKTHA